MTQPGLSNAIAPKTHRWIDLIVALLSARNPLTFEQIAEKVPGYYYEPGTGNKSVKRKFERDKKELRDLGLPLDTKGDEGDENSAYQIKSKDFYMPYLALHREGYRPVMPQTIDQYGYTGLSRTSFEPDDLIAISDAINRLMMLEDPSLLLHVKSAAQKLTFDLPVELMPPSVARGGKISVSNPHDRADPVVMNGIASALADLKEITFRYTSMSSGEIAERRLHPYGLFFLMGHWYLVGYDLHREGIRNFRVNRISDITVNTARPSTPDYIIPKTFKLEEHASSRHAWELGDGDSVEAVVEFSGETAALIAQAGLGTADDQHPDRRTFKVRRIDTFVRWLLSLERDARPVSPPLLVSVYTDSVVATMSLYKDSHLDESDNMDIDDFSTSSEHAGSSVGELHSEKSVQL